jgi:hypothetical protein
MPFPFVSDSVCEQNLPWNELVENLKEIMKDFSLGKVNQPVRATLEFGENGFFGKKFLE